MDTAVSPPGSGVGTPVSAPRSIAARSALFFSRSGKILLNLGMGGAILKKNWVFKRNHLRQKKQGGVLQRRGYILTIYSQKKSAARSCTSKVKGGGHTLKRNVQKHCVINTYRPTALEKNVSASQLLGPQVRLKFAFLGKNRARDSTHCSQQSFSHTLAPHKRPPLVLPRPIASVDGAN